MVEKVEKATNDIIEGIINVKNEKLIKEHLGQISFRNDVILESHFDSLQEGVADVFKGKVDAIKAKLDKTKYSPAKKALIMQVIKDGLKTKFVLGLTTIEWFYNIENTEGKQTTFKIIEVCKDCNPDRIEDGILYFGEYSIDTKNE